MRDTIGIDSFRVGNAVYTDEDLATLPIERLEELKIRINSDIIELSGKIKFSEVSAVLADYRANHVEPRVSKEDADWYFQAVRALGVNQRFLPYLSNLVKRRLRQSRTMESFFVDAAREHLEPGDFDFLLNEARERFERNASR